MRNARKLVVKKETLGELSTSDLRSVAGGTIVSNALPVCVSVMVRPCPTNPLTDPVCDLISDAVRPCLTENC